MENTNTHNNRNVGLGGRDARGNVTVVDYDNGHVVIGRFRTKREAFLFIARIKNDLALMRSELNRPRRRY